MEKCELAVLIVFASVFTLLELWLHSKERLRERDKVAPKMNRTPGICESSLAILTHSYTSAMSPYICTLPDSSHE